MKYIGIKQAVSEFNKWQGHAEIMFDKSDGKVWCDVFASDNEDLAYHSDTIDYIMYKNGFKMRNHKTNVSDITEACDDVVNGINEWQPRQEKIK